MAWSSESRHKRGYGSDWDKIRLTILRRDNGLCQCDECKGGKLRVTHANEVHHIVSKAKAKLLGWGKEKIDHPSNLMAINKDCHKLETEKDKGNTPKLRIEIGDDGWPV